MNRDLSRRLMGGFTVLHGLAWLTMIGSSVVSFLWDGQQETVSVVFSLLIGTALAIPGIFVTQFGIGLFREMRLIHLKGCIGAFALLIGLTLSSLLSSAFSVFFTERLAGSIVLPLMTISAISIYLLLMPLLLRHLSGEDRPRAYFINRGILGSIAFVIWMKTSDIFEAYSPIREGYTHIYEEPWYTLSLIVPIALAYGFYRVTLAILKKNQGASDHSLSDSLSVK